MRVSSRSQARAHAVVQELLARWDADKLSTVRNNSEPPHVMGVGELVHARLDLARRRAEPSPEGAAAAPGADAGELAALVGAIRSALDCMTCDDVLSFDASRARTLPQQLYCLACGEFPFEIRRVGGRRRSERHGSAPGAVVRRCAAANCGAELRLEVEFDRLTEALVWTSVFRDVGIAPVALGDAAVGLADVLALMPRIRPYRSLESCGAGSFTLQCYFVTHLVFVLSQWGRVRLEPRSRYCEEYLFLAANLRVVIWLADPELVGEFVHALHILGCGDRDAPMQQGRHYLLAAEKDGETTRGNWVTQSNTYKTRSGARDAARRGAAAAASVDAVTQGAPAGSHAVCVRAAALTRSTGTTRPTAASSAWPTSPSTRQCEWRAVCVRRLGGAHMHAPRRY